MLEGLVFDIKRFAVHDGKGIRTTIFLKGCPLRCKWCHNPEGLNSERNVWYIASKCIGCGDCVNVCKQKALSLKEGKICFEAERCIACGACIKICPTGALKYDSNVMTSQEIINVIMRDRIAYDNSGGGVTISGGEPTFKQKDLAIEILKCCKEQGIHTAIESCMMTKWETVEEFIPLVDQFIVDIKIIDPHKHMEFTGADNTQILENIKKLSEIVPVLIRTPMIPGYTEDLENINAIGDFVAKLKNAKMELLNFNTLYVQKYSFRGKKIKAVEGEKLTEEYMEERRQLLKSKGVDCI